MLWLSRLRLRLRSLLQRQNLNEELTQELSFHLEQQKAEFIAEGMTPDEADAAARRLFGSQASLAEECRDQRRTRWLEDLAQDTRYAWRSFAQSPAFTLTAVLTLALGIGANTAFFSTAYGILFRPLPYPSPGRIVNMPDGIAGMGPVVALRDLSRLVDYAGCMPGIEMNLQFGGEASRIRTAFTTWNLLRVLGINPAHGRWFTESEEFAGHGQVVMLSDRTWRRLFNADPSILGQRIILNEESVEIIGIMPPGFAFPTSDT